MLDRFGQVAPRVLFTADGYFYNGKTIDSLAPVRGALRAAAVGRARRRHSLRRGAPDLGGLRGAVAFGEFGRPGAALEFTRVPFDAPLYVMYSSGTTGVPKCIVHGVGGTLLQHRKEHLLHTDLTPDDRLFYFTTCGWMMWNWLVSGLATGCTVVLYEGSPFAPGPRRAVAHGRARARSRPSAPARSTCRRCEKDGGAPGRQFDLGALRTILSTGSPLAPEQFDYVYRAIKADLHLASISGGTDIISCFCLGNPVAAGASRRDPVARASA